LRSLTTFFDSLYRYCDDGAIEIRTLPGGHSEFFDPFDTPGITDYVNNCARSKHIYFGVALRDGEGGKRNLT